MPDQTSNTVVLMRVMLVKREAYRVTSGYRGLRVRAGRAWVTLNGRDHVLKRGQGIAIQAKKDFAVVSALGHAPLIIELLGEAPRHPTVDPRPAVNTL